MAQTDNSLNNQMVQYMANAQQLSIVEHFLNPKPVLDEIYQFLKCVEYREIDGKIVEEKAGDPLINDIGINVFMACIKSHINQSTVQANMDSQQIKTQLKELNIDLIQLIASKWVDFEIQKQHFDIIVDLIDHHIEAFLSRTKEDKERERFKIPNVRISDPQIEDNAKRLI